MARQALPAYVINLDRRTERWARMQENLDRVGVIAERISAVDAGLLAEKERETVRRGVAPSRKIDLGATACLLSHAAAYGRLLQGDAPAALILEDDAELAPDTATLLESIDWWPCRSDVVRLEDCHPIGRRWSMSAPLWYPTGTTPSGRRIHRLERWAPTGSAAYLISRGGAEYLMQALARPRYPIDHILFDLRVAKTARQLRPTQVVPAMARHRLEDGSDLDIYREETRRRRTQRWQRLKRNLSTWPYKGRLRILMLLGLVRKTKILYRAEMG